MKIILLDKIKKLGNFGEIIVVKNGYARNFLIPIGKAAVANKTNISLYMKQKEQIKTEKLKILSAAKETYNKINLLKIITIKAKSGKYGKLFGSVKIQDIINIIKHHGISIVKKNIYFKYGNPKSIGKHRVYFKLHENLNTSLLINVIPK